MNPAAHLLIDGYNVIHQWSELKELNDRNIETARSQLIEKVQIIHDFEGIRTTLVFDGKGSEVSIERPYIDLTFSTVFTPSSMTADDLMEQMINKSKFPNEIIVVSHDNLLCETSSAIGAQTMSPEYLKNWVSNCEKRQTDFLVRYNKKQNM